MSDGVREQMDGCVLAVSQKPAAKGYACQHFFEVRFEVGPTAPIQLQLIGDGSCRQFEDVTGIDGAGTTFQRMANEPLDAREVIL